MTEQTKGFNFFLNSSSKEIHDKDNPSLEYIVIQNDFLHNKVKELESHIYELTQEKEQFEEDNERCEKRLTALRGIAFNECEMSKLLQQVVVGHKNIIEEHKKIQKDYQYAMRSDYLVVTVFYVLNYIFGLVGLYMPLMMFYALGVVMIAHSTTLSKELDRKSKHIKLDVTFSQKEQEYNKLRKNQDYISTMIENM